MRFNEPEGGIAILTSFEEGKEGITDLLAATRMEREVDNQIGENIERALYRAKLEPDSYRQPDRE